MGIVRSRPVGCPGTERPVKRSKPAPSSETISELVESIPWIEPRFWRDVFHANERASIIEKLVGLNTRNTLVLFAARRLKPHPIVKHILEQDGGPASNRVIEYFAEEAFDVRDAVSCKPNCLPLELWLKIWRSMNNMYKLDEIEGWAMSKYNDVTFIFEQLAASCVVEDFHCGPDCLPREDRGHYIRLGQWYLDKTGWDILGPSDFNPRPASLIEQ